MIHPQQVIAQMQPGLQPMQMNPMEKYKKILFCFGITEIVLGGLSCLLGVVTIILGFSYYASLTFVGQGIWCGVVLIVCGVLGLLTRSRPTRCMYNANMAMSIVTAIFMMVLVILSGMAAALDSFWSGMIAFHSIIALIGFAALIITIIHSAYCCAGVCCLESYPRQVVFVGQTGMMPVQLVNGQTVLYHSPAQYAGSPPYLVSPNPVVNMPSTQVPIAQSTQPTMSVGQPVQSASMQAPVYQGAPPMYTTNSQK